MGAEPVDVTAWPVVVVTVDEAVDVDGAHEVVRALDEVLRGRQRMGFVFDYQRGEPEAQEVVSRWLAARVDVLERLVVGAVTVVRSASLERVRSMIEVGGFPMPFPAWATDTVEEGVRWVRGRLDAEGARRGVEPPPV